MARIPRVSHSRNPGIARGRSLLQVIQSEPDIRIRRAALAARARGDSSYLYRGGSVTGQGFVSSASGGQLKRQKPASLKERDTWLKKAYRGKLIKLNRAEKVRLGLAVPKKKKPKPVTVATVSARRSRIAPSAANMAAVDRRPKY